MYYSAVFKYEGRKKERKKTKNKEIQKKEIQLEIMKIKKAGSGEQIFLPSHRAH